MEVKKSLWAERDCRQLSNRKHQHGSSILQKERQEQTGSLKYHNMYTEILKKVMTQFDLDS